MPWSPQCGRWTACLGRGRLQRISVHFWNRNTTQMSLTDLGRTLRKLLAAFHTFQHQFSPEGNRNQCTHAATLSPPSWDAMHTAGRCSLKGFHRANAGRYRSPVLHIHLPRDDTCPTLLPLCYILQFPGEKISHGIKWWVHAFLPHATCPPKFHSLDLITVNSIS